jgi:acetolactate synthase regulatory subunit
MSHRITLRLAAVEGALLRVIGTAERRGFRVLACDAVDTGADGYRVQLDIDGSRDPQLLCRQLARLLDVREVGQVTADTDAAGETRIGYG